MALSRYSYVDTLYGGKFLSNSDSIAKIQEGIRQGVIEFETLTLAGKQRLDSIAGQYYGDSTFWWIIAAASGIGWWLQVPAGTYLVIPTDLSQIETLKESL